MGRKAAQDLSAQPTCSCLHCYLGLQAQVQGTAESYFLQHQSQGTELKDIPPRGI